MATKRQPTVNQMETQYSLGKNSIVKNYVVVKENIKTLIKKIKPNTVIDIGKYIDANVIQIGRIAEANYFNKTVDEEIINNVLFFIEIAENYGQTKIEIINSLTDKEYQKIFDRIQIANDQVNESSIINKKAFVSDRLSKIVNKHLKKERRLNDYDRIEYQW